MREGSLEKKPVESKTMSEDGSVPGIFEIYNDQIKQNSGRLIQQYVWKRS